MQQGKIVKIVSDRGFGFIQQEGEEKNIFFHSTELSGVEFKDLQEGQAVQFELSEGPKGLAAVKVSLV